MKAVISLALFEPAAFATHAPFRLHKNKMKRFVIVLSLAAGLLTGCSFAMRTNVAILDKTVRPANSGNVEVFRQGEQPARPYEKIAFYSLASHGGQEANVLQGFIKLARKQGADAILFDTSAIRLVGHRDDMSEGGVGTFRATAVVWADWK